MKTDPMNNRLSGSFPIQLTIDQVPGPRRPSLRARRQHRARWWFQQMRIAVSETWEWRRTPPARHEQTYLTFAEGR